MTPRAMPPWSACAPQRDAVSHPPFSKTTPDTAYFRKYNFLGLLPSSKADEGWAGLGSLADSADPGRGWVVSSGSNHCVPATSLASWERRLVGNVYL